MVRDYVWEKIVEFQEDVPLTEYPLNLEQLCNKMEWTLIAYSELNTECFSISKDGFTVYKNDRFIIFYNMEQPHNRVRFTIAHEIGHIILNHHFTSKNNLLCFDDYTFEKALENEANIFARNILMPTFILKELPVLTPYVLSNEFIVSEEAAQVRLNWLEHDCIKNKYENIDVFWSSIYSKVKELKGVSSDLDYLELKYGVKEGWHKFAQDVIKRKDLQ